MNKADKVNENVDIDTSKQPDWLELPDKREYWTCSGKVIEPVDGSGNVHEHSLWSILYYGKEDAEAHAYVLTKNSNERGKGYVWDTKSAHQVSLSSAMLKARQLGRIGILIYKYSDNKWEPVKKYPCSEPLPDYLQ